MWKRVGKCLRSSWSSCPHQHAHSHPTGALGDHLEHAEAGHCSLGSRSGALATPDYRVLSFLPRWQHLWKMEKSRCLLSPLCGWTLLAEPLKIFASHPFIQKDWLFRWNSGIGHPWTRASPCQQGRLLLLGSFCHYRELTQALKFRDVATAGMSVFPSDTKHNAN